MTGKKKLTQGRDSTDAFKTRMPPTKVMYHRFHRDQFYRSEKDKHREGVRARPRNARVDFRGRQGENEPATDQISQT